MELTLTESNVSVVIATKNEGETIENCLKSIFDQSVKPREVIVVDGHSTDDTLKKALRFPVKILVESGRVSPSNARNLGVQNATAEIVLVLDADTELDKDCIRNAIEYFQHPDVLVVIPNLEIQIHTRLEKIQKNWFYGTRSRLRTPHGTGSSIQFIRKDIYNEVKFDPEVGFGDDSDFRRRLRKLYDLKSGSRAQKIVNAQDSKIFVNLPHSLSEIKSQYLWYGRTSPKYFVRYHSIDAILRLGSILMPTLLLVLIIATLINIFVVYLLIPFLVLLIARNVVACLRSKSLYFLDFVLFDFMRSLLFIFGVAQGFFVRRTGR